MILRRIHAYNQPASTGGGGGVTTAFVEWGPNFGGPAGDQYYIGVHTGLVTIGVAKNQGIGVAPRMTGLAATFNAQTIAVSQTLTMGPVYSLNGIGVHPTMPALSANYNPQGIGVQPSMPLLGLMHDKGIGVHLTGTVLGAPFLLSSTATFSTAAAATYNIAKPAGTVDGDLLIAVVGTQAIAASGVSTPSGWTLIDGQLGGTNVPGLYTFSRVASGEPASYTFSELASGSVSWIATIMRIGGFDTTTPVNARGTPAAGSAADPVAPSVTTTVANCLKIACCAQANTALAATYTPPASYVEISDLNATNAGLSIMTGEVATRVQAVSGASGTVVLNSSQIAATDYKAQHFAIAPGSLTIA